MHKWHLSYIFWPYWQNKLCNTPHATKYLVVISLSIFYVAENEMSAGNDLFSSSSLIHCNNLNSLVEQSHLRGERRDPGVAAHVQHREIDELVDGGGDGVDGVVVDVQHGQGGEQDAALAHRCGARTARCQGRPGGCGARRPHARLLSAAGNSDR